MIGVGSAGVAVKQAQCEVNRANRVNQNGTFAVIAVDGLFGSNTARSIRYFQACVNLPADGIVGLNTWNALNYYNTHSLVGGYPKC